MTANPPLRVLIVEDEVLLATELEYLVTASGAEPVGHAMTSPEALDLAERLRPDLALVDVHLGDGPTGVEAARGMTDHCGAVVLFITANLKRLPSDLAGACGVMSKPYSEHQVRAALGFIEACMVNGRATCPPPQGLQLSAAYAELWNGPAAA
ncbi:MAG TPA: response regulator [Caulobacteraceae bacterium]|jgi:DNA-binding response OmpR family regulator|nr:response regulator [Caulobacteraceae bacterium]